VFKEEPSAMTQSARVDGEYLIQHVAGLNSSQRPLSYMHQLCKCWFDGQIETWFFSGLQRVYDMKPSWPTRKCLQCAFICMWIELLHSLAEKSRKNHEERELTGTYPGERFLRNGGKAGYYTYLETWLNKLDHFSGGAETGASTEEKQTLGAFLLRIMDTLQSRFDGETMTREELDFNAFISNRIVDGVPVLKVHVLSSFWGSFKSKHNWQDDIIKIGGVWKGNRLLKGRGQIKYHAVPAEFVPLTARSIAWDLLTGAAGNPMPTFSTDKIVRQQDFGETSADPQARAIPERPATPATQDPLVLDLDVTRPPPSAQLGRITDLRPGFTEAKLG